jgi:hypothetical protein
LTSEIGVKTPSKLRGEPQGDQKQPRHNDKARPPESTASIASKEGVEDGHCEPNIGKEQCCQPCKQGEDRHAWSLSRERNGPRSGKSQAEAGQHRQIDVELESEGARRTKTRLGPPQETRVVSLVSPLKSRGHAASYRRLACTAGPRCRGTDHLRRAFHRGRLWSLGQGHFRPVFLSDRSSLADGRMVDASAAPKLALAFRQTLLGHDRRQRRVRLPPPTDSMRALARGSARAERGQNSSVIVVLFFVAPFVVGLLLSVVWPHRLGIFGVGVALVLAYVVTVYLRSPRSAEEAQCSDCGHYLGRWWEPWLVGMFAIFGLVLWMLGAMTGRSIRSRDHPAGDAPSP